MSKKSIKVDENSAAVKIMRQHKILDTLLNNPEELSQDVRELKEDVRKFGVSMDEYILKLCEHDSYQVANLDLLELSLNTWLKYQQTYVFSNEMLDRLGEAYPELSKPESIGNIKLPFPAIFVIVNYDHKENRSFSFLMHQRFTGIDVTVMTADSIWSFTFNEKTVREDGIYFPYEIPIPDEALTTFSWIAWCIIKTLSIYRREPNIVTVQKVKLAGEVPSGKEPPTEWRISRRSERLAPIGTAQTAVFDTSGLIPPGERPEVFVVRTSKRASPRGHDVRGNAQVYWTGPGRKIPRVIVKDSYHRGRDDDGTAQGSTRICE